MSTRDAMHLTADELDSLLNGGESGRITSHLATCSVCLAMVTLDQRVVTALGRLPRLEPAPGFADRVMARVTVAAHSQPQPVLARSPRAVAARRRVAIASLLAGGTMAAGLAWASTHPAEALRFAGPALRDAGHSLWLSLQSVAANASDQPWYGAVRDTLATPARALPAVALIAGAYAVTLSGLRRLMTEPVPHARW